MGQAQANKKKKIGLNIKQPKRKFIYGLDNEFDTNLTN